MKFMHSATGLPLQDLVFGASIYFPPFFKAFAAASSVLSINLSRLQLQLTSAREKSKIFRDIQYLSIFAKYGVHLFRGVCHRIIRRLYIIGV